MLRPPACFLSLMLTTLVLGSLPVHLSAAVEQPARAEQVPAEANLRTIGELDWFTDYGTAYKEARETKRQLIICFELEDQALQAQFEENILAKDLIADQLSDDFVRAILPLQTLVPDEETTLMSHAAFHHMHNRPGIAILDLTDENSPLFGLMISAHPFTYGRAYSLDEVQTVLSLPSGTITQRTLIYALKRHPERPQSVNATPHNYLMSMSNVNSSTMARMHQVGHHNWSSRFHQINGAVGGLSSEVAVSGNGFTLLDIANDCIRTWRSSAGHWNAMRRHHRYFGYDMVQGANGTWYATGIFVD